MNHRILNGGVLTNLAKLSGRGVLLYGGIKLPYQHIYDAQFALSVDRCPERDPQE